MRKYKKWSKEELDTIVNTSNNMKDKDLATLLSTESQQSVTIDMIRRQRRNLKIKKKQGRHRNTDTGPKREV